MEFDISNLNDEDIDKINDFIVSLKKEKKPTKWWIMPNFDIFSKEYYNDDIKLNYYIEEQKDSYSKSRPPLKTDFDSKEEAEKWLNKYVSENFMFNSARDDLNDLILGLDLLRDKLSKHEKITQDEWDNCFRRFSMSVLDGNLYQVIKWNKNVKKTESPKTKVIKESIL